MAVLRPFRALRYDPAAVGDLSAVVAPPYDVISDAHRDILYARSALNVVRLILSREPDPYSTAGELLRQWRREGVLTRERQPVLCYYVENFTLPDGGTRERSGVIGVVRLEPFSTGRIRPHERTFARAKEDRMRVLQACRANLSPIFGVFADQAGAFDAVRSTATARRPDIEFQDDSGRRHRLWLLTDSRAIETSAGALADEPIVIADGHHRYETALGYQAQRRAEGATDPDAPHNFVLMYLTSVNDPGLVILPTHRVLAASSHIDGPDLVTRLRRHFRLIPFAASAAAEFRACLSRSNRAFGVALGSGERVVATLDQPSAIEAYVSHLAPVLRHLDVTILDSVVLRGLLGLDCTAAAHDGRLTYTHDGDVALDALNQGACAAFLMNRPRMEDVLAVCGAGETMPEKSTYFYPKLVTGLVFHSLNGEEEEAALSGPAAGIRPAP